MKNKLQLFCFTYAGGNATFYNQLENYIHCDIEIVKMEYAGHGIRYKESFYSDFFELAQDMYTRLKGKLEPKCKYALMGYSMGSISAMEVLRNIINYEELPLPEHIFLAAHEPHTKAELARFSNDEMDNFVMKRTVAFGGIPPKLIHNRSFWRMYLPIYRADYTMIGKYDFDNLNFTSVIPATVFYSEQDTPFSNIVKWKEFFTNVCDFECYSGNHFFIQEHCQEMASVIYERLGI